MQVTTWSSRSLSPRTQVKSDHADVGVLVVDVKQGPREEADPTRNRGYHDPRDPPNTVHWAHFAKEDFDTFGLCSGRLFKLNGKKTERTFSVRRFRWSSSAL